MHRHPYVTGIRLVELLEGVRKVLQNRQHLNFESQRVDEEGSAVQSISASEYQALRRIHRYPHFPGIRVIVIATSTASCSMVKRARYNLSSLEHNIRGKSVSAPLFPSNLFTALSKELKFDNSRISISLSTKSRRKLLPAA